MLIALSISFSKTLNSKWTPVELEPTRREFYVVQASNRYKIQFVKPTNLQPAPLDPTSTGKKDSTISINSSEYQFSPSAQPAADKEAASGTNIAFNIRDSEDNQVDSILI